MTVPPKADGDALARTAISTVRNIARAGGRPLPADVPPATQFIAPPGASPVAPGETTTDAGGGNALLMAMPAILFALASMVVFVRNQRRTRSLPTADLTGS